MNLLRLPLQTKNVAGHVWRPSSRLPVTKCCEELEGATAVYHSHHMQLITT